MSEQRVPYQAGEPTEAGTLFCFGCAVQSPTVAPRTIRVVEWGEELGWAIVGLCAACAAEPAIKAVRDNEYGGMHVYPARYSDE